MNAEVLDVKHLSVSLDDGENDLVVVNDIDFSLSIGGTLALVGESGSGKTMTALALLGLIAPTGRMRRVRVGGSARYTGKSGGDTDLLRLGPAALRAVRGAEIGIVFQEPMTSLNPVMRIGDQIAEAVLAHEAIGAREAHRRALALLERVGIPDADAKRRAFPHELSGGMRQRVLIAVALAARPRLLIADEPTTALDVTIQAQVVALIRELQAEFGMAVLFITHDLGLVAQVADTVAVMYAGRIVEHATVERFFAQPAHPYSQGLLRAMPTATRGVRVQTLVPIPGTVPSLHALPKGCAFHPRCPKVQPHRCASEAPRLVPVAAGCRVACWRTDAGPFATPA